MIEIPAVSDQSPWLGLNPFTEDLQQFFHGRDAEAGDLFRRIKRRRLTVLFGQSGLGKTSLVQAGLFPQLRPTFLPVPLRLDYSSKAPAPTSQIKQAVYNAISAAGLTTKSAPTEDETLWAYFHRPEAAPFTAEGAPVGVVLAFDQFEENFTVGMADAANRPRRDELLRQLGDLVENRVPKSLEAQFAEDETLLDRYQFDDDLLRVLFSLREDYLPELESLRPLIPSLAENRMRLTPMSGEQALEAVLVPGGSLVSREVAEQMVQFVAAADAEAAAKATATLSQLRVDPALLSLFCRELNDRRLEQRLDQITPALLQGSGNQILQDFYDKCFADLPAKARMFVEDRLLTEGGQRQLVSREEAERSVTVEGATSSPIDELVRRRLLHVEERFGVSYVELTHDRLAGVVELSRRKRRQVEAAETVKAAQEELRVSRRRLMIVSALAILAIVGAGVAVHERSVAVGALEDKVAALQHAKEKEQEAERARQEAERQKVEADTQRDAAVQKTEKARKLLDANSTLLTDLQKYYDEHPEFLEAFARLVDLQSTRIDDLVASSSDDDVRQVHVVVLAAAGDLTQKLAKRRGTAMKDEVREQIRDRCRRALEMAEQLSAGDELSSWRSALRAVRTVAGTLKENGDFDPARDAVKRSLVVAERVQTEDKTQGVYWTAVLQQLEGEIFIARAKNASPASGPGEDRSLAAMAFDRSIASIATIEAEDPRYQMQAATVHTALGNLYLEMNRLADAQREHRTAKQIRFKVWEANDTTDNQKALASSADDVAWVERRLGNVDTARAAYDEHLKYRRALARSEGNSGDAVLSFDNTEALYYLASALKDRGDVERELGTDSSAALPFYEESGKIAKDLVERRPGVARYHQLLAASLRAVGLLNENRAEYASAYTYYKNAAGAAEEARRLDAESGGAGRASGRGDSSSGNSLALGDDADFSRGSQNAMRAPGGVSEAVRSIQDDLAYSYSKVADVCLQLARIDEAATFYEKCRQSADQAIAADPTDTFAQRQAYFGYIGLADVANKRGRIADAKRPYDEARKIALRQREADPNNTQAMRDFAYVCNRLGDVCLETKTYDEARAYFDEAGQVGRRATNIDASDRYARRQIYFAYLGLADVCDRFNETVKARDSYDLARESAQLLVEGAPGHYTSYRDMSYAYNQLGNMCVKLGRLTEARAYYGEELWIDKALADAEPNNLQAKRDLGLSYNKMADISTRQGNLAEALQYYLDGCKLREALVLASPGNGQYVRDLAYSYNMLGDTYRDLGQHKESLDYYSKARDTSKRWTSLDAQGIEIQKQLYFAYLGLGDANNLLAQYPNAIDAFEKAIEVVRQRPQNGTTTTAGQVDLTYLYSKVAEMSGKAEKYEDAVKNYETSRDIALRLLEADSKSSEAKRRAYIAIEGLGDIYVKQKKFAEGRSQYDAALVYARQLVEANPTNVSFLLSLSWTELLTGHYTEAIDVANRGLALSTEDILLSGNLAHGLLLSDKFDKASELYQRFKDKRHQGKSFTTIVQEDFKRLRELQLIDADLEQRVVAIEKLLGIE